MRRLLSTLLILAVLLLPGAPAWARPALLDARFGGDGIVTAFPNGGVATAVGIDTEGRITAVGYTIERHPDVVVARFLPNGSPDPSFNGDGTARFDLGADDYAFDAAFTPNGGIAITGRRTAKEDRVFVLRLKPDGTRLRSFSGDGQVFVNAGTRAQSADAIAFTPQGRIVLGGYVSSGIQARSLMVRLSPAGQLDPGFSGDGIARWDLATGTEQLNDLLVLPGGSIVAAGVAENSQQSRFCIARVRSDGHLDDAYGRSRGYTLADVARGADEANALTIAENGDYLLAGSSHGDQAIAAFSPSGKPDLAWGNHGHRVLRGDATFEEATDIVPIGNRVYVVGTVHADTLDVGIARLRASGKLDTSFSGDGRFRLDVTGTRDAAAAAALQPNGKLVAAGQTWRSNMPRFLVLRLRAT
jgi:uncharacterized delta-60 repeat protein